jgi:hypothetical protein
VEPRDRIVAFVLEHLPPPGEPWPRIEREWFLAELERLIEECFPEDGKQAPVSEES